MIDDEACKWVKGFIDGEAESMNSHSEISLQKVSTYVQQLNSYIDGDIDFSFREIEMRLEYLVANFSITLTHPVDADLKILRAVKYIENNTTDPYYEDTSRLSYIPLSSGITPSMGRFNRKGESVYYGCIYFDDDFGGRNVAFSEVQSLEEDIVNLLISKTTKELELNYIGMLDNIFRGIKPYYVNDDT